MSGGCGRRLLLALGAVVALVVGLFLLLRPSGVTRRSAVPSDLQALAVVPGFPNFVRYFPTDATHVEAFEKDFLDSNERERLELERLGYRGELPPVSYLAISGGGDNGAFGAGLLNGWSATGDRPTFKLVTGVSTGALIAPFAFLGPAYDATLRSIYTGISFRDIALKRSPLWVLFGDAMADNAPLRSLVKKHVTQEVLDAIANERDKGRILLVATTNLDARRPVIWNVTEIAAARSPKALELVQKILVASSAIPGTFPPVMIDVLAGGRSYQEMHVDGATAAQVFVYPTAIQLSRLAARKRTLYIIRNARLDPQWAQVERRTLPIAFRAIACLVQFQGIGDLYTIYTITQRDRLAFNLAFIPPTFDYPHEQLFDTKYMAELFAVGERMAVKGTDWWWKHPPVLLSGVPDEEHFQ
ncbi:MAG TPA: patatin-like phospholipase family protein [Thermoanaerobaculia bacterium]|nr:patatin-like phospholipase family protein [Thermoanaerobaculia bacterium]